MSEVNPEFKKNESSSTYYHDGHYQKNKPNEQMKQSRVYNIRITQHAI